MTKNLKIFFLLALVCLVLRFSTKPLSAQSCPNDCYYSRQSLCEPRCSACSGRDICPTSAPYSPPEDITGKVFNPVLPFNLSTTPGVAFLGNFLRGGIALAFVVGIIIFFFVLLSGAIKWITAGGDKGKLEGSQKQITHALIGLAILLSAFAIIQLLERLFGVSLLNITLPTLSS